MLAATYCGRSARTATPVVRKPVLGYQHPLAVYDMLLMRMSHETPCITVPCQPSIARR